MMRVVSGIQTSGSIHLGNYLGAIKNWVKLQDSYECFYFLADLHAITVPQDPVELKNSTYSQLACLIAAGINIDKSTIFTQSSVSSHSELGWILTCATPVGWLKRMTQFKDKSGKGQDLVSCGLFSYPSLMAADILLYDADFVPVGEDQTQHLELTRDIAESINNRFNKNIFKIPSALIQNQCVRIKSLRDGSKKMSKSDPSDMSRINISDSPELILEKIKKSKTDSLNYISYEPGRLELANLIEIFANISSKTPADITQEYEQAGFSTFKNDLAECLIEELTPIRVKYSSLLQDKGFLDQILKKGSTKASLVADSKIKFVKEIFGFTPGS